MNFDYFVERAKSQMMLEMAEPAHVFPPDLYASYKNIYNLVKNSATKGTGINPKVSSSIRAYLYDYTDANFFNKDRKSVV
jgi:hypothetical protein